MEPTLHDRDVLLVSRIYDAPQPGWLVVATLPGGRGPGVKRVGTGPSDDPLTLAGGVWLERDNPREGTDSWLFGAVPAADVHGRVLARLWPQPCRFSPR